MQSAAVEIENEWWKAAILPEVGCKIQSIFWKPGGQEVLWQNPRLRPRPYPVDANFDNYWSGGWDDAFPTCDACDFAGEHYPNLGELRSADWITDAVEPTCAAFSAFGPISPVRAEKWVSLDPNAPVLRMRYRIRNIGVLPLSYIWGTHPALRVNENCILRIPGRTGVVRVASSPALGTPGQTYPWPMLGTTDMSRTQPSCAGLYCGHHVTGLEAGWFALEDRGSGSAVLFGFPVDRCPALWLWMCYGGWRGYGDVIVVEPWTSMALGLDQAAAEGSANRLEADAVFEAEIQLTPYRAPDEFDAALRRIAAG